MTLRNRAGTTPSVIFAVLAGGVSLNAIGQARDAAWCEAAWDQTFKPYGESPTPDYSALLRTWERLDGECGGTGIYEARLASVHLMLKQPAAAQEALRSARVVASEHAPLLDATRLQADLDSALTQGAMTPAVAEQFAPRFEKLVRSAPTWYLAHEQSATFWLMAGDLQRALSAAERAIELEPNSWWGYRTMAIAHSELREHQTAAVFGDRAHALHAAVSADADLMLALAKSYSALGMPQMSETLLSLLLTHRPAVRSTPQYRDALIFMQSVAEKR
jgi:tetratricopeptide (TPR) repeat protein